MKIATKKLKVKWACPKCGAVAHKHGKGGVAACHERRSNVCEGFICECPDDSDGKTHGRTYADPCTEAKCYHCGHFTTRFPAPPKGLAPWEKKALESGWAPPASRAKELGL